MNEYNVLATVRIGDGRLMLSDRQAETRTHRLKATAEENVYEIVKPVEFKAGEIIGYDGTIPRNIADKLTNTATEQPGQSVTELLLQAIAGLDPNDEEQWTKAGKPEVLALRAAMNMDITAAERDRAWEQYQAQLA